jgi:hypothetical protein
MHRYYFFVSFYCETPTHKGFQSFTYYAGETFPSFQSLKRYAEERLGETLISFTPITIQPITATQYEDYGDN